MPWSHSPYFKRVLAPTRQKKDTVDCSTVSDWEWVFSNYQPQRP